MDNIKLVKCPYCNENIPENAAFCPGCFNILIETKKAVAKSEIQKSPGNTVLHRLLSGLSLIIIVTLFIIYPGISSADSKKQNTTPEPTDSILPTAAVVAETPGTSPQVSLPAPSAIQKTPDISPTFQLPQATVPVSPEVTTLRPTVTPLSTPAPTPSENVFEYTVSNNTATITKYIGSDSNVTVPAYIAGYKVSTLGRHCFYNITTNVKSIVIENGISKISYEAFEYCSTVESVMLPDSVTNLGSSAFSRCTNLNYVRLPAYITEIEAELFRECTNLTSIALPSGLKTISSGAFAYSGLQSISIPANVAYMDYAFNNADNLIKIEMENGGNKVYYVKDNTLYKRGVSYDTVIFDANQNS